MRPVFMDNHTSQAFGRKGDGNGPTIRDEQLYLGDANARFSVGSEPYPGPGRDRILPRAEAAVFDRAGLFRPDVWRDAEWILRTIDDQLPVVIETCQTSWAPDGRQPDVYAEAKARELDGLYLLIAPGRGGFGQVTYFLYIGTGPTAEATLPVEEYDAIGRRFVVSDPDFANRWLRWMTRHLQTKLGEHPRDRTLGRVKPPGQSVPIQEHTDGIKRAGTVTLDHAKALLGKTQFAIVGAGHRMDGA